MLIDNEKKVETKKLWKKLRIERKEEITEAGVKIRGRNMVQYAEK